MYEQEPTGSGHHERVETVMKYYGDKMRNGRGSQGRGMSRVTLPAQMLENRAMTRPALNRLIAACARTLAVAALLAMVTGCVADAELEADLRAGSDRSVWGVEDPTGDMQTDVPPMVNLRASCLAQTFDCAPAAEAVTSCRYHEEGDVLLAEFAGGVRTAFYGQGDFRAMLVSSATRECYQATESADGNSITITNRVGGLKFNVTVEGVNARVACPDGGIVRVNTKALRTAIPSRPASDACQPFTEAANECQTDADCGDSRLSCCDGGSRRLCAAECVQARPHQRCDNGTTCGGGDFCCAASHVRVCDFPTCGDQVCCYVPNAMVCAPETECQQ